MTVVDAATWFVGSVHGAKRFSVTGRSIVLTVPGWPGNIAGQHIDLRLTAEDGYQAVRSYSLASSGSNDTVEIVVDKLPEGEVSPFLVDEVRETDELELRGPLGGWFVWTLKQTESVQLIAGGSGIVPLMAMVRAHRDADSSAPFRLLYSVKGPDNVFFGDELAAADVATDVTIAYTRKTPPGWSRPAGRVGARELEEFVWAANLQPTVYVCGPTGFVESVASRLAELGHHTLRIRTERFGGA